MKKIVRFENWINENYKPDISKIDEIISILEKEYEFGERDLKKIDPNFDVEKYVIIGDKMYMLTGWIANKKRASNIMYYDIEDTLKDKGYDETTIRKAIRVLINRKISE